MCHYSNSYEMLYDRIKCLYDRSKKKLTISLLKIVAVN